ncbi:MAG: hypothetical protein KGS61_02445 [Verrucomicrobia bacterium]|nr:hypothetical protein [Verrucomicrobiota bacterium]
MLDFTSATAFTPGNLVTNALTPADSTIFYQFNATAGQQFYFDGRPTTGFTYTPYCRLYGPAGNVLAATPVNGDLDSFTLTQSGTYTLTVEGRVYDNSASGNYAFNLLPVTYGTNALTIGATVNGTIATLGQRQFYTFTLPAPATLYFDALTNADLYWRLDAPWGQEVNWRSFSSSDGPDVGDPSLPLPAGDYTLTVVGDNSRVTGNYAFRLLNFADATAFTPGTVVSNTLNPSDSTVLYQFNGVAGASYYFDGRPTSGFSYSPYCRIYAPDGNILMSQYVNNNIGAIGLLQSGTYTLTVEGRIYDTSASGTYAFNLVPNPTVVPQPLFGTNTLPDLVVSSVSVLPSSGIQSGGTVTVQWTDQNTGSGASSGSFSDEVTIRNTATGLVLVDSLLPYNEADPGNGPLAPTAVRNRQLAVRLPDGTNSVGTLQATVTVNALGSVAESSQANNSASTTFNSTLAPYPYLQVTNLVAAPPTRWLPGSVVTFNWQVTNAGSGTASTNWNDSVVVRNTTTAQVILNTTTNYNLADPGNGPLAPGDSRNRSLSFTMPTSANAYGLFSITVTADSAHQVFQYNPAGAGILTNSASLTVISAPDLVPTALAVSPAASLQSGATMTISWNDVNAGSVDTGGGFYDRVTVVNTNTAEQLLNTTVYYDPNAAGNGPILPGTARPRSYAFRLPDGPRGTGTLQVSVALDTFNQLVEVNPNGTGQANNTASIIAVSALAAYPDLQVVNLAAQPSVLASGTNVTIHWQDLNSGTAAAAGNWYDQVLVVNTNTGATLLNTTVYYDSNVLGVLTNATARDRSCNFTLPNGTNGAGTLQVTITADVFNNIFEYNPAGTGENNNTTSLTVLSGIAAYPDLQVVRLLVQPDNLTSGTNVTLYWQDLNSGTGVAAGNWYDQVTVVNTNTGATLLNTTIYYDTNVLGVLTNGTTRDRSCAFTLPNGTNGAGNLLFTVTADVFNSIFEYNASGTGQNNNTASLVRSSSLTPLPDLVITSITAPATAVTGQTLSGQFQLANQGLAPVTASLVQRVFLSSTPTIGGGVLAAQTTYTTPLDIGQSVPQSFTFLAPTVPGTYWLSVQADAADSVQELSKDNNVLVSPTPLVVQPAYTATVTADLHTALANTPIPMHGQATLGGTGAPADLVPLTIHVQVRGTDRTYTVLTRADGTFTNVFYPLPNEAGVYQIAATFPGVANPPSQDAFTLLGMSVAPLPLVDLIEGAGVTNITTVANLSDVPLSNLVVTIVTNQPNLTVTASLDTNTLAGFATANLRLVVNAVNASIYQSPVVLHLATTEGATADLTVLVRVEALRPQLVANPASVQGAMQRGGQKTVAFSVANTGGVATGPLQVVLPNAPWLGLASAAQLPPLPPGSNAVVTLLLSPAADLSLGNYTGTLVVQATNAAMQVPYSFRAISDATGNMLVSAEDEYTYFASGAPRVTNALVVLTDALSGAPVVTNYTGADGTVLFTNLTEAYYIVDVSADKHDPFRETALVPAGLTTNVVAFLSRQTVTYSFTVTPTTIPDQYTFQIDSTFETQVPIPVVTIEPASLDLSQYPGNEFQVNYTIANHGLIDAEQVLLNFPSSDWVQITPLITNLGKLSANSSLTVPVLFKRLPPTGPQAAKAHTPKDAASGTCSVTASMLWNYLCGPNVIDKSTAAYVFDSTGCDLPDLYFQVYNLVPNNSSTNSGNVITSQQYEDYLDQFNPVSSFGPPPGYHFECKKNPPPLMAIHPATSLSNHEPKGDNSVCAKVDLRLDQRGVIARDAFNATLTLNNDLTNSLQNIQASLQVTDLNGNLVTTNFAITPPTLSGFTAVDGTGQVPGNTTATATWTIIPTLDAAPTNGMSVYLVGGTLSYTQSGAGINVPLAPAPIQVYPQPELLVRYFHDRNVYGDDPFTPQIEPSIPYSLAVEVQNVGYGAAHSLSITSAKPQVVDNVKGLLIDFTILGTQVENQPVNPSLTVNLGEIDPGTNRIARWLFTSSLQGSFTNFSASFSEVDQFGKPRLSLIRSVEIHELTHIVDAPGPFEDGRPDFLVNDVPDPDLLPDTIYLSDGSTQSVSAVTNPAVLGALSATQLSLTVTSVPPAGCSYFQFPDPGPPQYRLARVLRADNSEVPLGTNAWTTDRFFRGGDLVPILTNQVHLFDYNSAGIYTLFYVPTNSVLDTTPPTSAVAPLPAISPPSFSVTWSGRDNPGGSGIALYNIYVSVNGGPFALWITNTTQTAALYPGTTNTTYAFFSRATDAAGNQEAAHTTADAQTSTTATGNAPPSITSIPDQTVADGSLFSFTPTATDPDLPAETLTWRLLPGAPPGALLAPGTGRIAWQTGPADNGTTNQFTLVVTDSGSPSLSATQSFNVVVLAINHPPTIAPPPPVIDVDAGASLSLTLTATDPDLPFQTLTWQLGPGTPPGLTLDPVTGLVSWTPTVSQSPSTNLITVIVTDNGKPPMSDTNVFTIVVHKVNHAPVLAPIASQAAAVLTPVLVSASAQDPDLPPDLLTFSLDPGAPPGASINPTNGLFVWVPTQAQGSSTNLVTVRVTDNGLPPLSDTQTFAIVVGNFLEVTPGSTIVQAGQTGAVAIAVNVSAPITNLTFLLNLPVPGLTNLTLAAASPPLAAGSLLMLSPSYFKINLQTPIGQTLEGPQVVATLGFLATSNATSAFVPLKVAGISANQANGQPLMASPLADTGRVALVGRAPLLEATLVQAQVQLAVYGALGSGYSLQSTPSLSPPVTWSPVWTGTLTNLYQVVLTTPGTNAGGFYRAVGP